MLPANIWLFSPSMKSIRSWLLWLILLYQLTLKGQSYYSSDITTRVYKNLQVALQDPDKVFRLDLSNQELTRIPLEVFTLTYLEVLVLDGNNMQEVTFQIDKLPNLKLLSLKRNKLREFHIPKKCTFSVYGTLEVYFVLDLIISGLEVCLFEKSLPAYYCHQEPELQDRLT